MRRCRDLDETLIIFNSLLNGTFAQATVTEAHQQHCNAATSSVAAARGVFAAAATAADTEAIAASLPYVPPSAGEVMRPDAKAMLQLGSKIADFIFSCCDDLLSYQASSFLRGYGRHS